MENKLEVIIVGALIIGGIVGYGVFFYTYENNEKALQAQIETLKTVNNNFEKEYNRVVNELSEEKLNKDITFNTVIIEPGDDEDLYIYKLTMKLVMTFNSSYEVAETAIMYVSEGGTITVWDKAITIHEDMIPEDKWFEIVPRESYSYRIGW